MLQLEASSEYGGIWGTVGLDVLFSLLDRSEAAKDYFVQNGLEGIISSLKAWHVPDADLGGTIASFSVDLAPHVIYGAGPLISLLLHSGAHNYAEFKHVDVTCVIDWVEHGVRWRPVPSSRADIFRDAFLKPEQKRKLMRFLTACGEAIDGNGPLKDYKDRKECFYRLMEVYGLDSQLQQCMAHGVLLQSQFESGRLPCAEAFRLLRMYFHSVGRFGIDTGPFIVPMYGCSDLSQAFARAAAVRGAVQVLRCPIMGFDFDEHSFLCKAVDLANGQKIRTEFIVGNHQTISELVDTFRLPLMRNTLHRCLVVLDRPLIPNAQQGLAFVPQRSDSRGDCVWMLQLGHGTRSCPQNRWLIHLWCVEKEGDGRHRTPEEIFWPLLEAFVDIGQLTDFVPMASQAGVAAPKRGQERIVPKVESSSSIPTALIVCCFSLPATVVDRSLPAPTWPGNVCMCNGPGASVALDDAVVHARELFTSLFNESREGTEFPFDLEVSDNGRSASEEPQQADADGSDDEDIRALRVALGLPND